MSVRCGVSSVLLFFVFFFKQKTAYELRISDWSSDVCSSDLNQPGARRVDDRRVISGILHVLKSGCRWCDCPADYGPSTTVYNRFNRWSRRGFWTKLLDALAGAGGDEEHGDR